MRENLYKLYKNRFKGIFDIVISLIILGLALPFISIVTFILAVANKGKPFFTQVRPGKKGKPFRIIKFKTMNDKKDPEGNLLPDADRLTSIGAFVRKTSLDELPQLINVLRGDISMVGPRPLLMEYLPLYSKEQARRHEVKPGITGWAQVNGRNAISWNQKFEYDVWYVDNVSFLLDLKILFRTILKVVKRDDISSATSVTMEYFKGDESNKNDRV
ncbi:sugar transferase [Labilibaculum euxinus]|uniref:Lipid carrier--UDP-N-acetylgalactosaminyltransferase n=1 Tax=Labilibaculum euxinus TaxID=2686357 RepID=A0A7M4DAG4_9BACT|nr:sugar transferase [Labilibaculum euxinus]MUP39643.1 lipid carrier--UDP-N-acetylgalactosaminyltransferase [Labilibaculum euxinus]MVB08848.1 lipid carrier--UDP-N-acetylgalactosaminyltransferase [Labilibaculum euxinus]